MSMNSIQENYCMCKAFLQAVEETMDEMETDYVRELGTKDDNGEIAKFTWTIADEEEADRAMEGFGDLVKENGMQEAVNKAREDLVEAENALLDFAISILPPIRDWSQLREAANHDWKIREKMIETVLHLDTSTIPEERRRAK